VSYEILFAAHVLPIAKFRRTTPGPGHSGEPGGAPSAGQRARAVRCSDRTRRPTAIALGRSSRSGRLAADPENAKSPGWQICSPMPLYARRHRDSRNGRSSGRGDV